MNLAIQCLHEAGQQPWGSSAAGLLAQAAAEIEKLQHERAEFVMELAEYQLERERLREALRIIGDSDCNIMSAWQQRDIACEALKGSP